MREGADRLWNEARHLLIERALERGIEHRLASGGTSTFYVDVRRAVSDPRLLHHLGVLLWRRIQPLDVGAVGGPATGGIALAAAASLASLDGTGPVLPWFFVRPRPKTHGTQERIEGSVPTDRPVVLVEDVVTTGGSVLEAARCLLDRGLSVTGVIAVVDRLEGGRARIENAGLSFDALFTRHDLEPPT